MIIPVLALAQPRPPSAETIAARPREESSIFSGLSAYVTGIAFELAGHAQQKAEGTNPAPFVTGKLWDHTLIITVLASAQPGAASAETIEARPRVKSLPFFLV